MWLWSGFISDVSQIFLYIFLKVWGFRISIILLQEAWAGVIGATSDSICDFLAFQALILVYFLVFLVKALSVELVNLGHHFVLSLIWDKGWL